MSKKKHIVFSIHDNPWTTKHIMFHIPQSSPDHVKEFFSLNEEELNPLSLTRYKKEEFNMIQQNIPKRCSSQITGYGTAKKGAKKIKSHFSIFLDDI